VFPQGERRWGLRDPSRAGGGKGLQTVNPLQGKEGKTMKAGVVFTGTGPILILTSYDSLTDAAFVEKMAMKGIKKFIAYEIPVEKVKGKYRAQFDIILGDLNQTDDLRVLDYNGHNIFYNFNFSELGEPILYEP